VQNKANFKNAQMNVSSIITREYGKRRRWTIGENKANQSQFLFFTAAVNEIQTQSKPISNQKTDVRKQKTEESPVVVS